nr:GrpB family protein [Ornithinimicrobium sp. HY1793]
MRPPALTDRTSAAGSVTRPWDGKEVETDRHYPAERVVSYDAHWPSAYRDFAAGLFHALGLAWEVEHVGSTSVPGLVAKPVIDLALRLPAEQPLTHAAKTLVRAGWTTPVSLGDHWATFHLHDHVRTGIGHIFTADQWDQAHVRLFARWLREYPDDRDRYARLKVDLLDRGLWGGDYTAAKTRFVHEIVNRARAEDGLPPLTHLRGRGRSESRCPVRIPTR